MKSHSGLSRDGTTVARTTGYLLVATVVRNLGPLAVLLALTRLTDPATVGRYSLALAMATPVYVLAQLNLRMVYLTLRPPEAVRGYVDVQSISVATALVVVCLVGAVSDLALVPLLILVSMSKSLDAFVDMLSGPLQAAGRADRVLTGSALVAACAALASIATLAATRSLETGIAALVIATAFALWVGLFRPVRALEREQDRWHPADGAARGRIVRAGLPLGVSMAVISLISTFPQYVITAVEGHAATGRFAILLYVYALGDLATGAVSQAWIPHGRRDMVQRPLKRSLGGPIMRWTAIYVPGVAGGLWIAWRLLPIVFGSVYALSWAESVPIGVALLLLPAAHFTTVAVNIQNRYRQNVTLGVAALLTSVVLCWVLIPQIGIAGGFWALVGALAVRTVVALLLLVDRQLGRG